MAPGDGEGRISCDRWYGVTCPWGVVFCLSAIEVIPWAQVFPKPPSGLKCSLLALEVLFSIKALDTVGNPPGLWAQCNIFALVACSGSCLGTAWGQGVDLGRGSRHCGAGVGAVGQFALASTSGGLPGSKRGQETGGEPGCPLPMTPVLTVALWQGHRCSRGTWCVTECLIFLWQIPRAGVVLRNVDEAVPPAPATDHWHLAS